MPTPRTGTAGRAVIDTVSTITSITDCVNVQSVDLIDRITLLDTCTTVDTVTEVANVTSVDLVDRLTLVDTITEVLKSTSWTVDETGAAFAIANPLTVQLAANSLAVGVDANTNALETVDYEHHEIHAGSHYRVQAFTTSGTSVVIAFKVPDQAKDVHMVFEWVAESAGHLDLYKGATWDTNTGTRRTCKNSNCNFADNSIVQGDGTGAGGLTSGEVVVDPTNVVTGSNVRSRKYWFSSKQAGGGEGQRRSEIVLAPNNTYAFVWTSDDGAKGFQMRLGWYEHESKA